MSYTSDGPPPHAFVAVCPASEIVNGQRRAIERGGHAILIFNLNRVFYAVRDRCTHLDYQLNDGKQVGHEIICRQHGARFDLRTGKAIGGPAVEGLRLYPVRIVHGMLEVGLPAT